MHDGLLAADARIRSHPDLAHTVALLVAHRGDVVFERYYGGSHGDDLHSIHSVTKSVASTVVGILAGDGVLALDDPLRAYVPVPELAKQAVTLRHLLTMTSGLYGHGWWDIDELEGRGEPVVAGALAAPLVAPPGWGFLYNNGASHALSAVVETVTGARLAEVAATRLFRPLGIDRWRWPADPQGRHWACGSLELTPRDLLKLGLLYLAGGRQVIGEAYVRTATSPLVAGGPPEMCGYGLLWWVADRAAPAHYFAAGHGGQYMIVVPELDLVIVTMADADAVARPRGSLLRRLVYDLVLPVFTLEPAGTGA